MKRVKERKQIDWEKIAERAYELARKDVNKAQICYQLDCWSCRPSFIQRAWVKAIRFSVTQINKER